MHSMESFQSKLLYPTPPYLCSDSKLASKLQLADESLSELFELVSRQALEMCCAGDDGGGQNAFSNMRSFHCAALIEEKATQLSGESSERLVKSLLLRKVTGNSRFQREYVLLPWHLLFLLKRHYMEYTAKRTNTQLSLLGETDIVEEVFCIEKLSPSMIENDAEPNRSESHCSST